MMFDGRRKQKELQERFHEVPQAMKGKKKITKLAGRKTSEVGFRGHMSLELRRGGGRTRFRMDTG